MRRIAHVLALALFVVPLACGDQPGNAGVPDASTPEQAPLEITTITPADGASAVAQGTAITATFSRALRLSSVTESSFLLFPSTRGQAAAIAGTFRFSGDAQTVTFQPTHPLAAGTEHTLLIRSGTSGVVDQLGVALIADSATRFTTDGVRNDDETPPELLSITPADGATNVPLDSAITLKFSEKIDPDSLTSDTFEVVGWWEGNPQGAPLSGHFDTSANPIVVWTPSAPFEKGDEYKVTVRTGVKDLAGNALQAESSAIFDAAWVTPGETAAVTGTTPADGATGVFLNAAIQIVFGKRMAQSSVTSPTTVKLYPTGHSGSLVTMQRDYQSNPVFLFHPQANLAANTQYTLEIVGGAAGVKDEGQNPMPQTFTTHFTTGATADTSPLTITSVSPADGATGASHTATVSVTFDKPVDPASLYLAYTGHAGTFTLSRYADGSTPVTGSLDFSGNPVVRFTLAASTTYELERQYYVKITGGTSGAKALSGSRLAQTVTTTFTTQGPDNPDGTIADLRAVNGACAIRVKGVTMTFFRDQPSDWKGFFVQKEQTGPGIFVVTGGRNPLFPIYPQSGATGFPNVDLTVTHVSDFHGFKQVDAFTMTRNQSATADLTTVKDTLVQVVGDVALGEDFESEYLQIDGTLQNYKPGASAENREYDLAYGTGRKVKLKISQFGLRDPMGLGVGSRVRVLAPLQRDQDGFFVKPYKAWDAAAHTTAELDQAANYPKMLDIAKLAP